MWFMNGLVIVEENTLQVVAEVVGSTLHFTALLLLEDLARSSRKVARTP
jgi:hypothetical protein